MYKKYIHPCYNWYDLVLKKVDDKTFVSSTGEIYPLGEINSKISEDKKKVQSGECEVTYKDYGLSEISELEFISAVFKSITKIKEEIVSHETNLKKIQDLTGVHL